MTFANCQSPTPHVNLKYYLSMDLLTNDAHACWEEHLYSYMGLTFDSLNSSHRH